MYELKKMERYLRVNLLRLDPRLMKKRIYRAAVSQELRDTALQPRFSSRFIGTIHEPSKQWH